jgi:hypothetical protein
LKDISSPAIDLSQTSIRRLREILRYLVIAQCVGLAIDLGGGSLLQPPEEINVAVELMAEEGRYEASGLHFALLACLIVAAFVLYGQALWQLYHFKKQGLSNFLWAIAAFGFGELIAPAEAGSWLTPQQAALSIAPGLATGGTLALCLLAPSIFIDNDSSKAGEDGTSPSVAPPHDATSKK